MLEELPAEAIPMADSKKLQQLHRILQQGRVPGWPVYTPEELTHSTLQLATLQATFGSLGEIAEIFLFEPRPEGFIIFYGNLQIPNFDGILSPQHGLIMIKTPSHQSLPIRSTAAPHYPTRRPAIGTLVTLSSQGRGRHDAAIVAIEQNYWLREWIYMIRIEEIGQSPEFLMAILDRGILNSQDISTRIFSKANREVAFFFNEFERLIQDTIIQKGSPGFYETVRMVQPLQAQLSPVYLCIYIYTYIYTYMNIYICTYVYLKSMIKWGPKIAWNSTPDTRGDTAIDQAPFTAR